METEKKNYNNNVFIKTDTLGVRGVYHYTQAAAVEIIRSYV